MDSLEKNRFSSGLLNEKELDLFEKQNPDGMSSAQIIDLFNGRGIKFSEATFRKYVQLGLLPRSRRVGSKGKHKGSRGLYPPGTARQVNEIKRMMSLDYTIEEIRQHFAFVGGEIEELRTLLLRIMDRLEESLGQNEEDAFIVAGLRAQISEARVTAKGLVARLEEAATRIRELRQTAREAV